MKKVTKGVYCLTSPSGKRYVGIGCGKKGIEDRWRKYRRVACYEQIHLYNALKKHGPDNFKFEIVLETDDSERAKKVEIQLIALWNTKNRHYGYNMTNGGDGSYGVIFSEDRKKKISISKKGKKGHPAWNRGLKCPELAHSPSEETIRKIKEANTGRPNKYLLEYNKDPSLWTSERRLKVSEATSGSNNHRAVSRRIQNIKTNEIHEGCLTQLARNLNLNPDSFRTSMVKNKKYFDWILIDGN